MHVGFSTSLTTLTLETLSYTQSARFAAEDVGVRCDVCEHGAVEEDLDLRPSSMGGDRDSRRSSDCANPLPIVSLHHRLAPPQQRQGQGRPEGEALRRRRDYSRRVEGNPGDRPPRVLSLRRRRAPPDWASGIMTTRSNLFYSIQLGLYFLIVFFTIYGLKLSCYEVEKGTFVNEVSY